MSDYIKKMGSTFCIGLFSIIFVVVICTIGMFGIAVAIPMFIYWGGLFEYNRGKTKTACCYWLVSLAILLYASHHLAEYFFLLPYEIYMGTAAIALIIIYVSYLQYEYFKLHDLEHKYEHLKEEYEKLLEERNN